jgi:ABC-2 type transport system ATP-binding protein
LNKIVLKVENVSKKFWNVYAVKDLSFEIHEGEIFGFLGPNGAGKTTTIRMITGLAKMDNGDIKINGFSVKKEFEKAIKFVGAIIETPQVYNNMSGIDNLKYYASLYKNITNDRIDEIVNIVSLKDRIKDKVSKYSLGMKQRLGIACALIGNPKLLILDEPTNGLDPQGVIEIRHFLRKIATQNKMAILISSHNLAEIELMCDTIAIINKGTLESINSIDNLKTEEQKSNILIKVNFPNYAGKLISQKFNIAHITIIKNTLSIDLPQEKIPELTVLLVSNGISIYSISSATKTLEDIFLDTINKKALPVNIGGSTNG